jgi:hypothetical protein
MLGPDAAVRCLMMQDGMTKFKHGAKALAHYALAERDEAGAAATAHCLAKPHSQR